MAIYTERVQTVLTEEQYRKLSQLAQQTGKAVSVLVREAIEETYIQKSSRAARRAALERLLSLESPTTDWKQMEAEIIAGAIETHE